MSASASGDRVVLHASWKRVLLDEFDKPYMRSLRAFLVKEREASGFTTQQVNEAWQRLRGTKGQMAGHWFEQTQWALPTAASYDWLRQQFGETFLP